MLIARYTKPLSITLSPEVYNKVRMLADQQDISMGRWFRNVADKEIKTLENVDGRIS